jgi:hypothetical protein
MSLPLHDLALMPSLARNSPVSGVKIALSGASECQDRLRALRLST